MDGDWIETFFDLCRATMERVLEEMNEDWKWSIKPRARDDRARCSDFF